MMRDRQFPWLCHQIVLVELVLMRAEHRKRTVNGKWHDPSLPLNFTNFG